MLGIRYDSWRKICEAYRDLGLKSKKSALQWFPFSKMDKKDWAYLSGNDFYHNYIENDAFVLFPTVMYRTENFMQKSDGSFRDASLVSPILYLVVQAFGVQIAEKYKPQRSIDIAVYYSGSASELRVKYKQDYDDFYKEVNAAKDEYEYFIKTDITNFYHNIDVNKLVRRIDEVCNEDDVFLEQSQLSAYKELLLFTGAGHFPLIENCMALSYLATVVYLDQIDCSLHEFIRKRVKEVSSFRMIRYVDDLYILFSVGEPYGTERLHDISNEIRNYYSSILREYGLALNSKKYKLKAASEINQELKKSLYDEFFNGIRHSIEELHPDALGNFLVALLHEVSAGAIDIDRYNELIDRCFGYDDIEFTPSEVYNYFVYECDWVTESQEVISTLLQIVRGNISVLSLDPKRLGVLIMKTHNDSAIKATLNELFNRNRAEKWNSYDTTIAIAYLIQSEFRHIDLLGVIRRNCPQLYEFYENYCRYNFLYGLSSTRRNKLRKIIGNDWIAYYLYFMYQAEMAKMNYMSAYAYYKNYFDRVTADIDFKMDENRSKKPNYKGFYKESQLKKFYEDIEGSSIIIEKAHKLRNSNPLTHSSSGLLDGGESQDIISSINGLDELILDFYTIKDEQLFHK